MPRLLAFSLLSLTLLTVACKKDAEPEAAGTLPGDWTVRAAEAVIYNGKNEVLTRYTLSPESFPFHLLRASDTVMLGYREDGSLATIWPYVRANDNLVVSGPSASDPKEVFVITKLTPGELVLYNRGKYSKYNNDSSRSDMTTYLFR